jgi:hypothetical protein
MNVVIRFRVYRVPRSLAPIVRLLARVLGRRAS